MGLKRAENQVKILLQETIIALCRNTLNSYGEVNVEGLLGVTLDNEEIFLVSINEMFNNPGVGKKHKKNLKRSKEAEDASESESERSDGDEHGDAPRKRKKKRARKKKKKADQGSGGSGEESDSSSNQDDDHAHTETEANTTQEDTHTEPTAHEIRPEPSSKTPTADDHRHKKSENDEDGNHDEDSNDLEKIKIKEELEEDDDDEDLVFVKEEIGDSSFSHNQYSNYSSDGQMYMPPGGMHSGQGGLMQMPGQAGVSNQYSQDFMGDMSNMSNMSQGSDSQQQQMMGFSPGQQNMSFTGASPVAGPSSASGKKPLLMCFLCGKVFKGPWNLKLHMRVHTGEKPHQCPFCQKLFSQTSHLKRHIEKVHQKNLENKVDPFADRPNLADKVDQLPDRVKLVDPDRVNLPDKVDPLPDRVNLLDKVEPFPDRVIVNQFPNLVQSIAADADRVHQSLLERLNLDKDAQ